MVADNGLGATFAEGDTNGFVAAIEDVATNYSKYQARMREFAPAWLDDNNAQALLDTFLSMEADAQRGRFEREASAMLGDLWGVYEELGRRSRLLRAEFAERAGSELTGATAEIERVAARLETRDRAIQRLEKRIAETRAGELQK